MCNKQRTFLNYNGLNIFFSGSDLKIGFILLIGVITFNSCTREASPLKSEIINKEYPKMADDIIKRDFDGLRTFVNHDNVNVRALAWKAIARSETDDLNAFVDYAIQHDDSLAWHALSLQPLAPEHVDTLAYLLSEGNIRSESLCEVFFRKGDKSSLNMLLKSPGFLSESEVCSKAVGGIIERVEIDDLTRRAVFDLAFNSDDEIIKRNLLYGFYRSSLNRPAPESTLMENLETHLNVHGESFSIAMDEYITRIAGEIGFIDVMGRRSDRELRQAVQLSNELAKNVTLFESNELSHPYFRRLLKHQVDHVVVQTLQSLQEFEVIPEELLELIESEIAPLTKDPEVFAEALNVLSKNDLEIEDYRTKLEFMDAQNEYLKHRILPLFGIMEPEEEFLDRIRTEISEGGIGGMQAVHALMNYYSENFEEDRRVAEKVKSLSRNALEGGDRSVISALNALLLNTELFSEGDYAWIHSHYEHFVDTSQWEKARILNEVLTNRFPERFESFEIPKMPFRIPNWDRLYEMGTQPFWVLETEVGKIEILLDPLAAPFTVSSIDSLTRAGAYDDVPFHRVVRNFVIQGGDIDRKDGFGGPGYRLPTEPSFQSFERGMVGIASSGQDTEGSQFFVMLGWAPHLNGNYTIFGKVTKGMDVADRIQVGERVLEARIYPN